MNIFSIAILEGDGILAACRVASKFTGFSAEVIRRWACTTYVEYFGKIVNIDDIDDEEIASELASNKGKHPKWISLFMDEEFQFDDREECGVCEGCPKYDPNEVCGMGGREMGGSGQQRDSQDMASQTRVQLPPA